MTRLSDDPDYLAHGHSYLAGDYIAALNHLRVCYERLRRSGPSDRSSFVLSRMAHVCGLLGDTLNALRSFRIAECEAPASLVIAHSYVAFLHDELADYDLARNEAARIIRGYEVGGFNEESRKVFDRDYFIEIQALQASAAGKLAAISK